MDEIRVLPLWVLDNWSGDDQRDANATFIKRELGAIGVEGRLDNLPRSSVVSDEDDSRIGAIDLAEKSSEFRVHRFSHGFVIWTRVGLDGGLIGRKISVGMEAGWWFMKRIVRSIECQPQEPAIGSLLRYPGNSVIDAVRSCVVGSDRCRPIHDLRPLKIVF